MQASQSIPVLTIDSEALVFGYLAKFSDHLFVHVQRVLYFALVTRGVTRVRPFSVSFHTLCR